jgi:hypothetical protein
MKKLFSQIFILGLLWSGNSYAQQLFCEGVNAPNASFEISNNSIIYNSSGGPMTFAKNWSMSKNIHKGKFKSKNSDVKWEVQIDTRIGEAQIITTTYYSTRNDDVYVRKYINCR